MVYRAPPVTASGSWSFRVRLFTAATYRTEMMSANKGGHHEVTTTCVFFKRHCLRNHSIPAVQKWNVNGPETRDNMEQKGIRDGNQGRSYPMNPNKPIATPGIADKPQVGYLRQTTNLTKSVGHQQSLRLSRAPLKPTTVSMMVESPQFGAQKATGSSYRAHDQWQKVGTNMPDSQSEQSMWPRLWNLSIKSWLWDFPWPPGLTWFLLLCNTIDFFFSLSFFFFLFIPPPPNYPQGKRKPKQ